jgi:hypothetical protein
MAATLEVKYFNTFWLKKIKSITDVKTTNVGATNTAVDTTIILIPANTIGIGAGQTVTNNTNTTGFASGVVTVTARDGATVTVSTPALSTTTNANSASTGTTLTLTAANQNVVAGMKVTGTGVTANTYIESVTNAGLVYVLNQAANLALNASLTYTSSINIAASDSLTFTGRAAGPNIPGGYVNDNATSWYEEESRIRGGYNNTSVDFGVKAYLVEDTSAQQNRISTLIYSGIFNSRTGINNTNQFSVGKDITRSADPANGSIQRLYAEDTNLIIFQEDKVSRALIDKDAIYSAEGNASITSTQLVIGQIVAYGGEYGISTNPESFAVYGYRKYFTDKKRGCVLRLSKDGITEISSYGMHDFFRDQLSALGNLKLIGSWDNHAKNYILSIQGSGYKTLVFDEGVKGWTSFLDFKPTRAFSLNNLYYTFNSGKLYQHYLGTYANFYGTTYQSDVTVVLNSQPSVVKVFQTVNYEGGPGWELDSFIGSSSDSSLPIGVYQPQTTLVGLEGALFSNNFKKKENKFFANLINASNPAQGEIIFGNSVSGVKGFFSTVKLKISATTQFDTSSIKKELFSIASNVVESSY